MGGHLVLIDDHSRKSRDVDRRIGKGRDARGDGARVDRRKVALQVDDDVVPALGVEGLRRLVDASEPDGWSDRVMTAWPPALSTTAAISALSVATMTGPTPDSTARSQTCTIIGLPLMSASGLFGRRVAAMRAGMTTRGSDIARTAPPGVKK